MLLRLNFNENPLGMPRNVHRAIVDSLDLVCRYPDEQRAALYNALAATFAIDKASISLGNGSAENIQAIVRALIHRAHSQRQAIQLIVPDPTFDFTEFYAKAQGIDVVKVPLTADMGCDVPAMQAAADTFDGHSLFYLANPNNPTSTIITKDILYDWIEHAPEHHFFLLDEAYAEFVCSSDYASGIPLIQQGRDNLAVTRTFSKLYALAGLRVGYALATPELIRLFNGFMAIDNSNLTGMVAALAALQETDFVRDSLNMVTASRGMLSTALEDLQLRYAPSHANFIYHQINGDVASYVAQMKAHDVWVGREFPPIHGWSRLTLGTEEEMSRFIQLLYRFREQGWV